MSGVPQGSSQSPLFASLHSTQHLKWDITQTSSKQPATKHSTNTGNLQRWKWQNAFPNVPQNIQLIEWAIFQTPSKRHTTKHTTKMANLLSITLYFSLHQNIYLEIVQRSWALFDNCGWMDYFRKQQQVPRSNLSETGLDRSRIGGGGCLVSSQPPVVREQMGADYLLTNHCQKKGNSWFCSLEPVYAALTR